MHHQKILRLTIAALLVAIDVVTSPLFRIEGLAPMSSVLNVIIGVLVNPLYAFIITLMTGAIRMLILGIPPLALTGAVFGGVLASLFYQFSSKIKLAWLGEIIGTGIIGSLLSYPVMIIFTGTKNNLYWFLYTPRFLLATLVGGFLGVMVVSILLKMPHFLRIQALFKTTKKTGK
jgi:energy coupling factor transporter S component ThiW